MELLEFSRPKSNTEAEFAINYYQQTASLMYCVEPASQIEVLVDYDMTYS